MAAGAELPHIDEHSLEIDATPTATWAVLTRVVEGTVSAGAAPAIAAALGCRDRQAGGPRPLERGSTVPGFHVGTAEQPRELALLGSHRFSDYALIFRLDSRGDGRTHLRAETRATFPGLRGKIYRALVIGTRAHVVAVRRMLGATRRIAER